MVELWRLVFAVVVVLNHTHYLPWCTEQSRFFRSGIVNFFFILSGFLMAQSIQRRAEQPCQGLGSETLSFLRGKLKGIYPVYLFSLAMDVLLRLILARPKLGADVYYLWDLLFLRASGLRGYSGDAALGAAWYLHAMFLAMVLLYPLARKYFDVFRHVLAPLLTIFLYGWFCNVHGNIYFTLSFSNGICLGLLRAVAGLCLGVVCHSLCCRLQELNLQNNRLFRAAITAAELLCFGGAIWIAKAFSYSETDFIGIFLLALGITCSFSGYSFLLPIAGWLPTRWIGSFSLALYLNHYVWIRILSDWKLPVSFGKQVVIFLLLSAASTFVCLGTVGLLTRLRAQRRTRRQEFNGVEN